MPTPANNRLLQQVLQAEGLYKGKIDGIIGPATRRALELHDKAKNQPLPRERPGPPTLLSPTATTGIADPGASASGQLALAGGGGEEGSETSPDPEVGEVTSPFPATMGLPNPASAEWVRAALGAVLGGRDRVPESPLARMQSNLPDVASEPSPAYTPNFAGAAPPAPLDQGALQKALQQRSLGDLLSQAVPRR